MLFRLALIFSFLLFIYNSQAQRKTLKAVRTSYAIKIDGVINDAAWKETQVASGLIEQRPNNGKLESDANKTEFYILYDNTSVYVAGYCYEGKKDSISKELVGRDKIGVNDFAGLILDTYNDKMNGVGFYVTPYGEQVDIKYSPTNEDRSWSAVWQSATKIHNNGWSIEMRIPHSALRFNSADNQTWGLNFIRQRNKAGQQFTWNFVDSKVSGFINQEGEWTGITKIDPPIRLSFSPYLSANVNHYKPDTKAWRTQVNGGMDVKYGLTESFTLDMTVVPDFGQVKSDNKILNLSPFEVQYSENRPFFTEGTELFSKGNLFYSRRIGTRPLHYYDVAQQLDVTKNEQIVSNPQESKLINATKISGRTKEGLGIGFFNAITKAMYAKVEDDKGQTRQIQTSPLINYNIIVLDQNLQNNSSVTFINTNVLRSGADYDANVSAGLFRLNNKKNTYNLNGKLALSQKIINSNKTTYGFSQNLSFGKTGGRWNYQITEEITNDKYDINDMGFLNTNNYISTGFWTGYRWIKPRNWYKRMQINFNANQSFLYKKFSGQNIDSKFKHFSTNINANAQLKNLWWAGFFIGYGEPGNDFYEPHRVGWSFKTPKRIQFSGWFESNSAKKYFASVNYFVGIRSQFKSVNHEINLNHRYRFNDKLSISQYVYINPFTDDAGFYTTFYETINGSNVFKDLVFSRRNRHTIENRIDAKYNFNTKSGITISARHYSSKVVQKDLYDLRTDGTLYPTKHTSIPLNNQNFNIFNIDAVYTLQFAPGSFVNVVWKQEGQRFDRETDNLYFKNFSNTLSEPQNNNLSVKIIYYLDYLDLKNWNNKKK